LFDFGFASKFHETEFFSAPVTKKRKPWQRPASLGNTGHARVPDVTAALCVYGCGMGIDRNECSSNFFLKKEKKIKKRR